MLHIKNGRVIDPLTKTDEMQDLLIEDGHILMVDGPDSVQAYLRAHGLLEKTKSLDARGMVVAPGLTDVHVHFRDPGFAHKEDIHTGAKAALAGGVTRVVLMANTRPVVDNEETLSYILQKGKETGLHVETCASVSMGLQGKELVDMAALKSKGAAGFTDDGIPLLDKDFARKAMEEAARLSMPISFHEEDPAYISENGINAGAASDHFNIKGSSRMAEISMIERDIALAKETGAEIDIQHISTKEGVELVRQARKTCSNIHAEATPHHFSLTEDAAIHYGTLAKMNPPLRTEEDRLAIIEGLKDGTIEIIATDHAPHSAEEKQKGITEAPSGIIGLETALPLAITYLVRPGHMSLLEVLTKMTLGPCALYQQLEPDSVSVGKPANLVLFHPDQDFVYEYSLSKSQNSPFLGQTLYGKVYATLTDGKVRYRNEKVTKER
ncbi:MAG: dihydroorotase [Lachnospiraceae bacterium]|nr:dihydroorotase [Lachnospiraceae bacterium]